MASGLVTSTPMTASSQPLPLLSQSQQNQSVIQRPNLSAIDCANTSMVAGYNIGAELDHHPSQPNWADVMLREKAFREALSKYGPGELIPTGSPNFLATI